MQKTQSVELAAALLTCGILPDERSRPLFVATAGGMRENYCFQDQSVDGKYNTKELIDLWEREERGERCLTEREPDHHLSVVLCFMDNMRFILAMREGADPATLVQRGRSMIYMDPKLPPSKQDVILAKFGA